jgi:hypothetical protein
MFVQMQGGRLVNASRSTTVIDYAAARRGAEPVATAPTESAMQWVLHRRMGANQCEPADVLVAARGAYEVKGSNRRGEWHFRAGLDYTSAER